MIQVTESRKILMKIHADIFLYVAQHSNDDLRELYISFFEFIFMLHRLVNGKLLPFLVLKHFPHYLLP